MSVHHASTSVDALQVQPDEIELASRTPLPASTSTLFVSSDTQSHLEADRGDSASSNSKDVLRNVLNESALPPVDKGLGAWSFLAAAFMVEAIVWGFPNAYGVFLDAYLQDPRYASQKNAASLLPLIGTLSSGIIYCSGIVITAIGSTEGADRKFPFWAIFYPLQRIPPSSLSSGPFDLKLCWNSWNNSGAISDRVRSAIILYLGMPQNSHFPREIFVYRLQIMSDGSGFF